MTILVVVVPPLADIVKVTEIVPGVVTGIVIYLPERAELVIVVPEDATAL